MATKRLLHVNPLKPVLRITRKLNEKKNVKTEVHEEGPMPWTDAAIVSLVLTLAQFFIVFLPLKGYNDIMNFPIFIIDSIKCLGSSFFSNFVALAGLREYSKRAQKKAET